MADTQLPMEMFDLSTLSCNPTVCRNASVAPRESQVEDAQLRSMSKVLEAMGFFLPGGGRVRVGNYRESGGVIISCRLGSLYQCTTKVSFSNGRWVVRPIAVFRYESLQLTKKFEALVCIRTFINAPEFPFAEDRLIGRSYSRKSLSSLASEKGN